MLCAVIGLERQRERRGWTIVRLSRESEVSERTLRRIEHDPGYKPSVHLAKRIADALGVPIECLLIAHECDGSGAEPALRPPNGGDSATPEVQS